MRCVDCGKPITAETPAWTEVIGYSRPRSQRGDDSGSSLVLREPTGRAIHQECAISRLHGIPRDQGRLDGV